jgi:hypothetical protein
MMLLATAQRVLLAVTERPSILVPTDSFGLPSIPQPANSADAINRFAAGLANYGLGGGATLAVVGVMYGGFLMSQNKVDQGRVAMYVSLGGLAVISIAYAVVSLIVNLNPIAPSLGIG